VEEAFQKWRGLPDQCLFWKLPPFAENQKENFVRNDKRRARPFLNGRNDNGGTKGSPHGIKESESQETEKKIHIPFMVVDF
jgi:hypothetical protein